MLKPWQIQFLRNSLPIEFIHAADKVLNSLSSDQMDKIANTKTAVIYENSATMSNRLAYLGFPTTSFDIIESALSLDHVRVDITTINFDNYNFVLGFPPCTYLCKAQLWQCNKSEIRAELRTKALNEFTRLLNGKSEFIALENPIGFINSNFKNHDYMVQPYQFGDNYNKEICFWTRNISIVLGPNQTRGQKKTRNHTNSRMAQYDKGLIHSSWSYYPKMANSLAIQFLNQLINK